MLPRLDLISSQATPSPSPAPLSPPIQAEPQRAPSAFTAHQQTHSLPSSPKVPSSLNPQTPRSTLGRPGPGLGATRVPSSFGNSPSLLDSRPPAPVAPKPPAPNPPYQPSFTTLTPSNVPSQTSTSHQGFNTAPSGPNYNISLPPAQPLTSASPPPPLFASQMSMSGLLAPSRPAQPQWPATASSGTKQLSKDDWGDFDPLA